MKVIAIKGSPRRTGDSNVLIDEILRGAKDAGHTVSEYFLQGMELKGCQACYACKQPDTPGCDCVISDGLKPYWAELHEADALILGAPIYAGSICGPMISYMNRHYCLLDKEWTVRIKPGIRVIGVFAQGQSDPDAYLDRIDWFLSDFERRNMIVRDKIIKTGREPVKNDAALMQRAYEDGLHLAD